MMLVGKGEKGNEMQALIKNACGGGGGEQVNEYEWSLHACLPSVFVRSVVTGWGAGGIAALPSPTFRGRGRIFYKLIRSVCFGKNGAGHVFFCIHSKVVCDTATHINTYTYTYTHTRPPQARAGLGGCDMRTWCMLC